MRGLDWKWRRVESRSYWIDPGMGHRGYASEAARVLCHEGFRRLGARRFRPPALEPSGASLAEFRLLGFVEEGREREAVSERGRRKDGILFGPFDRVLAPLANRAARAPGPG